MSLHPDSDGGTDDDDDDDDGVDPIDAVSVPLSV